MSLHVLASHKCQHVGHKRSTAAALSAVERLYGSEAAVVPERLCLAGATLRARPELLIPEALWQYLQLHVQLMCRHCLMDLEWCPSPEDDHLILFLRLP